MGNDAAFWDRTRELIADRFGLHFPSARTGDLRRGLAATAAELGLADAHACAAQLVADGLDPAQLRALASHLTIGETYFLRGDETFAALRNDVLPALIRARAGDRRLRIWSAACATGEEAYSLAIVLHELLPEIDGWDVEIVATDINPRFLRKAREAAYGEWSFRGTPAGFRARWFRRTREGRHALVPEIARMVRFAPLNLVHDAMPPASGGGPLDLILCRNVLMYFTPEQAARTVARLRAALAADGWLVVAPCEVSQALFARFEAVRLDGAILYRKPARAAAAARPAAPSAAALPPAPASVPGIPAMARPGPSRRSPAPANRAPSPARFTPTTAPDSAALRSRARALADQRRLPEALECCDRWLEADKLDADAHYLRAMILTELGRSREAHAALQRCVYLGPDAAMGSFALGNLERSLGRHEAADRHYRHALQLLQRQPSDQMLAHAEGVSATQLGALIVDLIGQERRA